MSEPKELIECVDDATNMLIIEEWDRYDKDQSGTISMEEFIVGETAWYASVNQNQKVPTVEMEERLSVSHVYLYNLLGQIDEAQCVC